jgi:nucleoside-diphosphate-sugar epimerase
MKICIIGCGYVGTAMAKFWQKKADLQVTVTTTTPAKVSELKQIAHQVFVLKGDDQELLKSVLYGQDLVLLTVGASNPNSYEEAYLKTAQALTKVLPDLPTIKQIIYSSSYSLYGDQKGAEVNENTPIKPSNVNGEILAKTEEILLSNMTTDLQVCILRLGGIYGPGRELVKIFGRIVGTTRPGNGEEITNWIHLDDIIGAVELARVQRLSGIYNIVDDRHFNYKELLNNLCEKHNLPAVNWDSSQPSTRPYNVSVSNEKIKAAGYQLIYPQMIF